MLLMALNQDDENGFQKIYIFAWEDVISQHDFYVHDGISRFLIDLLLTNCGIEEKSLRE